MKTAVEHGSTLVENSETEIERGGNRTQIDSERPKTQNSSCSFGLQEFRGYQIIKELPTKGAEADLYLVKRYNKKFVLKLYRPGLQPKEKLIESILKLSKNYQEDIVKIYEINKDYESNRWYEIQEYAKYGSLRYLMKKVDSSKLKRVIDIIIKETNSILKTLHRSDIIHRDLKPENLLIRDIKMLDLVITDFGVSSILGEEASRILTSKNGTRIYFAPESFSGYIGKEVDYWAFGIMVLEILLGKHPFSGLEESVIVYELTTKGVKIPENIDHKYKLLLQGLLTKDPKKRWSYKEIERWLQGDMKIPVYYKYTTQRRATETKGYRFDGKEFYDLKSLLEYMYQDSKYPDAKEHILRGYIIKWLESNGFFDEAIKFDKLMKRTKNPNLNIFLIYLEFVKPKDFIFMGKVINLNNLLFFTQRVLLDFKTGDNSPKLRIERKIIQCLKSGTLLKAYSYFPNKDEKLKFALNKAKSLDNLEDIYFLLKIIKNDQLACKLIKYSNSTDYKKIYYILDLDKFIIPDSVKKKIEKKEPISLDERNYISYEKFKEYNNIRATYSLKPMEDSQIKASDNLYNKTLNAIKNGLDNYELFLATDKALQRINISKFIDELSDIRILNYKLQDFIERWEKGSLKLDYDDLERLNRDIENIKKELTNFYILEKELKDNINLKLKKIASVYMHDDIAQKRILNYSLEEFVKNWTKESHIFSLEDLRKIQNSLNEVELEVTKSSLEEKEEEHRSKDLTQTFVKGVLPGAIIGGGIGFWSVGGLESGGIEAGGIGAVVGAFFGFLIGVEKYDEFVPEEEKKVQRKADMEDLKLV